MDNTKALFRRNWGYLVILALLGLYALLPNQCGNPLNIVLQNADELIDWIATWPEDAR